MNQFISDFLSKLELGKPQYCENLAMVPVIQSKDQSLNYITLEDGLTKDLLEIQELEEGASVNDVQFLNKSDYYALLFEGEEFLGAKQNRILNVSILVKPSSKHTLPVSCVEHGRWHHEHRERENQRFTVAKDRVHYARGRAMENRAVNKSLRTTREFRGNQSGVWNDIALKSERMHAESPTSASEEMYVSSKEHSERHVKSFKHQSGQIGAVFLVDSKVSGMDLFASEATHEQMLPRVVRSYSLDAIDSRQNITIGAAEDSSGQDSVASKLAATKFVKRLATTETHQYDGLAEGLNIRFEEEDLTGSMLVFQDQVLHLSAFNV